MAKNVYGRANLVRKSARGIMAFACQDQLDALGSRRFLTRTASRSINRNASNRGRENLKSFYFDACESSTVERENRSRWRKIDVARAKSRSTPRFTNVFVKFRRIPTRIMLLRVQRAFQYAANWRCTM